MLYPPSAAGRPLATAALDTTAVRAVPYRPDIDGLRAISVLAVILFHARVPGFAGGYVGVDVFFVISGYLITQLLLAPSERGVPRRLRDFYARRCRRILPALLVMLVATTPLAYWLFLPADLTHFGTQLSATALLVGNFVTWSRGEYFALQTPFNPLVHLWSIAVEEQFYLAFPLLFLAVGRSPGGRLPLLVFATMASLAICVWASYVHPTANFFLAPTRAWELLLGSLVALGVGRSLASHRLRDVLATSALIALAVCVLGYDRTIPYPGLFTIVPCVSTALLLATGVRCSSCTARWLSFRPLVFTGVISYSLYLWHVPVLTFAEYYNIWPLEPRRMALVLAAIYLLAAASWRYVEAPIRTRALLRSDAAFLPSAAGATAAIALLGAFLGNSDGLPQRFDATDAKLLPTGDRLTQDARACIRPTSELAAGSLCSYGATVGSKADVVLWGDSHAMALLPAYEQIAMARNISVHVAVRSSCRPLLDAPSKVETAARRKACGDFNQAVLSAIDRIDPALVILNAYWLYPDLVIEATDPDRSSQGISPPFEQAFEHTLRAIGANHRKICVVGEVPTLSYHMPYAYVAARRRGLDPERLAVSRADAELQARELDGYFVDLRRRHGFILVDPKATLCAGSTCALLTPDGRSVYRDDNHLAVPGAQLLTTSLEACFDGIG
jgi:peptidoglycan/LPS O-acetylase OafA/YrhL